MYWLWGRMLGWVDKFGGVSGILGWRLCGPVLGGHHGHLGGSGLVQWSWLDYLVLGLCRDCRL